MSGTNSRRSADGSYGRSINAASPETDKRKRVSCNIAFFCGKNENVCHYCCFYSRYVVHMSSVSMARLKRSL